MKLLAYLLPALVLSHLGGCSTFTDSIARSASEMATQNAVKAMREVDLDRQLHLTLVGGSRLNPGRNAAPRPVQLCVYVVQSSEWRPVQQADQAGCVAKERDVNIVAASRLMLAPQQIQQTQLQVSGMRELWVVVDADFAQRPVDYAPLRMKIEGRGWVHLSGWAEGSALYDGRQPIPALVAPSSEVTAPTVASTLPPDAPTKLQSTPTRKKVASKTKGLNMSLSPLELQP